MVYQAKYLKNKCVCPSSELNVGCLRRPKGDLCNWYSRVVCFIGTPQLLRGGVVNELALDQLACVMVLLLEPKLAVSLGK